MVLSSYMKKIILEQKIVHTQMCIYETRTSIYENREKSSYTAPRPQFGPPPEISSLHGSAHNQYNCSYFWRYDILIIELELSLG